MHIKFDFNHSFHLLDYYFFLGGFLKPLSLLEDPVYFRIPGYGSLLGPGRIEGVWRTWLSQL